MMRSWFVRFALVGGVALHVTSAIAWAQKEARVTEEEGGMLKWAIAVGLAVVICAVGFINAKRSHMT